MIVFRAAVSIFAIIMIFFGLIVMIAPTPFGFVLVILGFLLLTSTAPGLIRPLRKRWRWLDRRLRKIQNSGPRWLAKLLKRSDPYKDENEGGEKER